MTEEALAYPRRVTSDPNDLINHFPDGSPERQFFTQLCRLLSALDLPPEEVYGFGCILALELAEVKFTDGSSLETGSIEDLATGAAVFFNAISDNPTWWKSSYPTEMSNPGVRAAAQLINSRIPELSVIEHYEPWLPGGRK